MLSAETDRFPSKENFLFVAPMADVVSKAVRSRMMSGIKGKDTKPELLVRKGLHKLGFRYRIHAARQWFIDEGVFIRPLGRVIYLSPAYTLNPGQLSILMDAIGRFVQRQS